MSDETILKLGDLIIPVGAGRGITQTLQPIDNGDLRRTVNGTLLDLTRTENRKYESQVQCTDMAAPTLAGIWKGSEIAVNCIKHLRQVVTPESTNVTLIRDPVAGSVVGYDSSGNKVTPDSVVNRDVTFLVNVAMVKFRPALTMMVVALTENEDEYAAEEGWTIDLEEV